ncbi:DASH complex subunit Dam1 domain containing protein [Elaphomyces granulatus]
MEGSAARSTSRPRPSSRPTTPLRPSSRSSIRDTYGHSGSINGRGYHESAINALEPQFAELADSMADLEANFMHLQLMHESVARFSECFASFLYGLNMNAFCVDFPEAPIPESFRRARQAETQIRMYSHPLSMIAASNNRPETAVGPDKLNNDAETTFLTTDTSFIESPPTTVSSKNTKYSRASRGSSTRGSVGSRYSTRGTGRNRPSALPRGRGFR